MARKGTDVYGRLAKRRAGQLAGSSELQLELTRMVISGQDYPVVSSDYTLKGKGRGANTAEKVAAERCWAPSLEVLLEGAKGLRSGQEQARQQARGYRSDARPASEGAERDAVGVPVAATGDRYRAGIRARPVTARL